MPLTTDEKERYRRHLTLDEIGGEGQQRLQDAAVLVIGAGGLGSPVLTYLAASGVGRLGIVDDDRVSLNNLQRQILHDTSDIGRLKTESGEARIAALNPQVSVETFPARLTAGNASQIIEKYDLVVDGSDNFATRYVVNDACYFARKPLVSGALGAFDGQLTTIKSYGLDETGTPFPNYRCLFPEIPGEQGEGCAGTGVFAPLAGVIGTLAAVETLKELLGLGEGLVGRLLLYDARSARFTTIRYRWDPANPLTGQKPVISAPGPRKI